MKAPAPKSPILETFPDFDPSEGDPNQTVTAIVDSSLLFSGMGKHRNRSVSRRDLS